MHRAYSLLTVKSVDEKQRVVQGIASTPTSDRMTDVVEPLGAKFATPMPLLLYHDSERPVGRVVFAKATKDGIPFRATIPDVTEPGTVQDRVNEAWHSLKYLLIGAVSIGFRALDGGVERLKDGGLRFTAWEWLELSLVAIPANPEAVIQSFKSLDTGRILTSLHAKPSDSETERQALLDSIKSIDAQLLAASGQDPGGASRPPSRVRETKQRPASGGFSFSRSKGSEMKTLKELRELRTVKHARMEELKTLFTTEDHETTDEESAEFDDLLKEVKALDTDIRVAQFHAVNGAAAKGVEGSSQESASRSRGPTILAKKEDPDDRFKGQSWTRGVIAKALAFKNHLSAGQIAEVRWGKSNPKLVQWIKANEVTGGGTGSGEWGAELVGIDNRFTGDFVEFLYAMTVFDRLGLRPAPKNVSVKGQDGAATGYWTGESKGIPVSKADFSTVDLTALKVGAISVMSMELMQDSDPAAEQLVRDSLAEALSQRIDTTFLSTTAASAGVSPAGILNGVTALHTAGTDEVAVRTDIKKLYSQFITDKNSSGLKLVMNPGMAKAIGLIVNALGQTSFPGLGTAGGNLLGDTVVTGDNVDPSNIILLKPSDIWMIGDSGVQVSISTDAMIEQNSAPSGATDTPTAAANTLTSMFQEDSVAIKVVRRMNYKKRRTNAVQYIDDADYDGTVS